MTALNRRMSEGQPKSRRGLRCEPLEPRRPLAADVGIAAVDPGVLSVFGDPDPANPDDTIVVRAVAGDASQIEVIMNGEVAATRAVQGLRRIVVAGGRGDDTIRIEAPDLTIGCTIRGGPGNDTIAGGPRGDRIHGGEGDDTIDGGDGNDEIVGGLGSDYLRGGSGADKIAGGAGDDTIEGGLGNDGLVGGEGDDTIDGEAGIDALHGGDGDDVLLGGQGRDRLAAGPGRDRLFGIVGRDRFIHDDLDSVTENELANPLVVAASEADIRAWLLGQATRWHHEAVFGAMAFGARRSESRPTDGGDMAPVAAVNAGGDHSSTNNQVAGVDEADLIRTDGSFIYLVKDATLLVIDAADPENPAVVSRTSIEGYGSGLFLHGNRVTVLSQVNDSFWNVMPVLIDPLIESDGSPTADPVVGADALISIPRPYRHDPVVKATVIDMADRANPVILEETRIDGTLAAARSIGDAVHLVIENRPDLPWMPLPMPVFMTAGATAADETAETSPEEWRRQVATSDLESLLPVARSATVAGELVQELVQPGSLYLPIRGGGSDLLSIVSLTPTDETPGIDRSLSTLGVAGTVYASIDSVIVAAADYGAWWGTSEGATTLHEFSLTEETASVTSGSVPGIVIDQFAIDAHADGTVRVVTQTGWGAKASTNLFVLAAQGDSFTTLGSVRGLAPGEAAMSARFVGDTAYVVTFEQVDPLFVIDLADPTRPTVLGELVIPGFSSYLHPIDGTHLIGAGRSADLSGVKMSLFDVSVPAAPTETAFVEFVVPGGYAWSSAQWDHHAFSFFADRGVVAIPMSQWSATVSHALAVYSVGLAGGELEELARIEHDSPVSRSLRIGGWLYSISDTSLKVVDLAEPSRVVGDLTLS